ncbi:hypothetical protein BC834DRAFT_967740 [Gloeopeniophorella convolvens]|nr:hypothetical protein BC834DRAFT_967740 [Gloeopeniophorella convolvens]
MSTSPISSTTSSLASSELSSPLITPLNVLLDRLGLPFVLDTPLDLTPSLLLAILESLLQSRLPISSSIRESRSDIAKVQAMKVFLGVLETDVINEDVGLSDIDPRRLAAGEWEEVVFVAKLLCWLGKQMGILASKSTSSVRLSERPPSSISVRDSHIPLSAETSRVPSPSTRSTATNSIHSGFSFDGEYQDSETTVHSAIGDVLPETPRYRGEHLRAEGEDKRHPRCIHELEDPSFLAQEDEQELLHAEQESLSVANDDTFDTYNGRSHHDATSTSFASTNRSSSTVRYDGYIREVDADLELRTFEASRAVRKSHGLSTPGKVDVPNMPSHLKGKSVITRHTSPSHHALALLDERAKLLTRLANLNLISR